MVDARYFVILLLFWARKIAIVFQFYYIVFLISAKTTWKYTHFSVLQGDSQIKSTNNISKFLGAENSRKKKCLKGLWTGILIE